MSSHKLLSINNYHYRRGGAEAVYFEHDALFRELGWDTAFFAMEHPDNVPCAQSDYFVSEIEFGHDYGLARKIAMAGKIIWSGEARQQMNRLLQDFSPDIAHVHSVYHHVSPSILPLLKAQQIPVVLTAHDLKLLCPAYTMLSNGRVCEDCKPDRTWKVISNKCMKNSSSLSLLIGLESTIHRFLQIYKNNVDRVVAPSQFYRDKFVEWGWPAEQVVYIPNYVDVADFVPGYESRDYVFYFGRLVRDKGVQTLMRAAAAAGVPLRVAGTGPHSDEFRELADELHADIEFLGFQSGEDLHALIRDARAVVLPSEWYENAPISVLEAYALGTPVIGADIGGIPEMVEVGSTGWLFPSGDIEALAAVLRDVSQQSEDRLAEMGRAGRQLTEIRYTKAAYLQGMQSLYAELGAA